jgi:hypothetical protein
MVNMRPTPFRRRSPGNTDLSRPNCDAGEGLRIDRRCRSSRYSPDCLSRGLHLWLSCLKGLQGAQGYPI